MYRQFNIQQFYVLPTQTVFMCFVWIWEQTAIISLYSINWLVRITETEFVYCAVRTACLYIIQVNISLQVLIGRRAVCSHGYFWWYFTLLTNVHAYNMNSTCSTVTCNNLSTFHADKPKVWTVNKHSGCADTRLQLPCCNINIHKNVILRRISHEYRQTAPLRLSLGDK